MAKPFAVQFYNSSRWKNVRKLVLRRDQYSCKDCGGRATEVHHVISLTEKNIDDWDVALNPDNLQSLCYDCHSKVTHKASEVADGYYFDEDGMVQPMVPLV